MGCYDVFCALCGGPLTQRDVLDSPDPRPGSMYWDYSDKLLCDDDLEWLKGPLRMLGKREHDLSTPDSDTPSVEIFECSEFDDGGQFDVTDAQGESHWCYVNELTAEEGFVTIHFVMHGECLSILECALATYRPRNVKPSLDGFYDGLCAVLGKGYASPGLPLKNGYFGAAQFWGQDWEAEKGWEFIVANPINIPNATSYIISHLHSASPEDQHSKLIQSADTSDRQSSSGTMRAPSIQDLPPEILSAVEFHLGLHEAYALRLASKELATRLPLTQNFCQRRLIAGELFGLTMLDGDALRLVEKGQDWKRLVKVLAKYESFAGEETGEPKQQWGEMYDAPIGLKNHMRIWKIITEILKGIDEPSA